MILDKQIKVMDYSVENIQLMGNNYRANQIYLPYQYNPTEISKLKKFLSVTEKKYDVIFVGGLSPKRKKIFDELSKRVSIFQVNDMWLDPRDKKIASGKILLNVHYDTDYNVHEILRCDRWIFAGMMVVSEKSIWDKMLDISNLVIFEDYDGLVDRVVSTIKNYDTVYKDFMTRSNEIIPSVVMGRTSSMNYAKEMMDLSV